LFETILYDAERKITKYLSLIKITGSLIKIEIQLITFIYMCDTLSDNITLTL